MKKILEDDVVVVEITQWAKEDKKPECKEDKWDCHKEDKKPECKEDKCDCCKNEKYDDFKNKCWKR